MIKQAIIIDRHGRRRIAKPGEILRDGERLTVSVIAMDGNGLVHDGMGGGCHAPGFRFTGPALAFDEADLAASRLAAVEARESMIRRLGDAWKPSSRPRPVSEAPKAIPDGEAEAHAAYLERLANAWRQA